MEELREFDEQIKDAKWIETGGALKLPSKEEEELNQAISASIRIYIVDRLKELEKQDYPREYGQNK
jgi:diaminopimelate decarboxylase